MSKSFERDGKKVRLNTFCTQEVYSYMNFLFNIKSERFKLIYHTKLSDVALAKLDDVDFSIYANETQVEFTFRVSDAEKATEIAMEMTKWKQFNAEEKTFYVVLVDDETVTIIFENGYNSQQDYQMRFRKYNVIIKEF